MASVTLCVCVRALKENDLSYQQKLGKHILYGNILNGSMRKASNGDGVLLLQPSQVVSRWEGWGVIRVQKSDRGPQIAILQLLEPTKQKMKWHNAY